MKAAPFYLEAYDEMVKEGNFEEALKFKTKISLLVKNRISATPEDVLHYGKTLRQNKRFTKSFAIFDVACELSEKQETPNKCLETIKLCVREMMVSSQILIANDGTAEKIVRKHVIPLMHENVSQMENILNADEKCQTFEVSTALHYIDWCENLVGMEQREKTLQTAVERMKATFKNNFSDEQSLLFGALLHNSGKVCESDSRPEEAASFYKQAMQAHGTFKKASALYKHATQD